MNDGQLRDAQVPGNGTNWGGSDAATVADKKQRGGSRHDHLGRERRGDRGVLAAADAVEIGRHERAMPTGEVADAQLDWPAPFWVDIRLTLSVHQRGAHDPTFRIEPSGTIWRTCLTPAGPATLRLSAHPARQLPSPGPRIRALAWGPGAHWMVNAVPDLLGVLDSPEGFRPVHAQLSELARRLAGLRIGRTSRVLEALIPAVLEQKVVGLEARRAWRRLVTRHGSPAPGPAPTGMRVMPAPEAWLAIPFSDWHRAGVESVRARTIAAAVRRAGRLETVVGLPEADADRLLRSLPGVGPWTAAEVRQRACGDADAVSVGDYHIPTLVGWALAGEPVDDTRMLELLAPYAGHRYRVTRLLELGGQALPRRGPRLSARDYSAF
jgi:3-methyladenine DNA glycosylase/8-oxoguanine DNA glycosylase